MPSKSIAQQHLFQAAEHGADFPMANKLRNSMTHGQMHDFAAGSELGKPQHVLPQAPAAPAATVPSLDPPHQPSFPTDANAGGAGIAGPGSVIPALLKGQTSDIMGSNTNSLRQSGRTEFDATRAAIQAAQASKPKAPRHGNLGKFLHPRKDGKPHGSDNF